MYRVAFLDVAFEDQLAYVVSTLLLDIVDHHVLRKLAGAARHIAAYARHKSGGDLTVSTSSAPIIGKVFGVLIGLNGFVDVTLIFVWGRGGSRLFQIVLRLSFFLIYILGAILQVNANVLHKLRRNIKPSLNLLRVEYRLELV